MKTFVLAAPTAEEWTAGGNDWNPHQHWTGMYQPLEVVAIQDLLDRYQPDIAAYYLYSPLPGAYSLELQFMERGDRYKQCRQEYQALWDDDGNLKPGSPGEV